MLFLLAGAQKAFCEATKNISKMPYHSDEAIAATDESLLRVLEMLRSSAQDDLFEMN